MKLNFDGLVTTAVVSELNKTLLGAKVQQVRQHNTFDVTLELRMPGASYNLFISADPRFPRFLSSSIKRPSLPEAPTFCMSCRKHLGGYYLTSICQLNFDRIVFFEFESRNRPGRTLAVEIMGKHSNTILFDEHKKILGAVKNIGKSTSRVRQILPGREYELPPLASKLSIFDVSVELFQTLAMDALSKNASEQEITLWLIENFNGFGPFLSKELVYRSQQNDIPLHAVFGEIKEIVNNGDYSPTTVYRDGKSIFTYPIPPMQLSEDAFRQGNSISHELDLIYNRQILQTAFDEQKIQLLRQIKKSAEAARHNLESFERTLQEADGAERYKELGELLNASAHQIPNGSENVLLVDYYDPEMKEVKIDLNPKLTARENTDRYFKRYKKLKESVEIAAIRRLSALDKLSQLDSASIAAASSKELSAIVKLREQLLAKDLLQSINQSVQSEKEAELFDGHRIRKILTPEGWEILYGENASSNDYLTQRIARPNDVWLHARSIVGAHVVIRTSGHTATVPPNVMQEAARIAAINSDAKHSSLVPVDHTLRKYVRKPKNAVPGFVVYQMEKTIDIQPK